MLKGKGEAGYLIGHKKKLQKGISLNYTKNTAFHKEVQIPEMD